jgi:hypothetical protein
MLPPPTIRDWASKLIASEVDVDSTSAQTELATLRVYEKLRRQLCEPVGVSAFQALASRALSLTKSQFPGLSAVDVTTNGGLRGLGEVIASQNTDEDIEVGIILIAEMLRLFLSLLGEAATMRLIEDIHPRLEVNAKLDTTQTSKFTMRPSYFEPFENILLEADHLRNVSERLETLADTHVGVEELMSVAGNIRNIATVLDVFTLVRSKAGGSQDDEVTPPATGYVN